MSSVSAGRVVVAHRYRGPSSSGNGGYVAGLLAGHVPNQDRGVEVTLLQPPPLDVPLEVTHGDHDVALGFGGAVIARAVPTSAEIEPVDGVPPAIATRASAGFPGHTFHPFPSCFGCGTQRPDGLRIFPGPVEPAADGSIRVAAPWTPAAELADPGDSRVGLGVAWSALDCVGGWAGDLGRRLMVLGRISAIVDELPRVGEPHVVVGQARRSEGRRTFTASTLYDGDGRMVGRARHTWVSVDPAVFNRERA